MPRLIAKLAIAALMIVVGSVAVSNAQAARSYMACDNPSTPDYAGVVSAPSHCDLGFEETVYESQPVPGHATPRAIELRGLHWHHWGQFRATASGESCWEEEGESTCSQVEVKDSRPTAIGPAGFSVIYQLMRVFYPEERETDWYRPGVDY
jgi:hypothetical protein